MKIECEPDEHWPWAYEAIQDFQVERNALKLSIAVTNRDSRSMPAGLGWHSYFASKDPAVTDAKFCWPHRDDYLPTGDRTEIHDPFLQRQRLTSYLQGWNEARITCADGLHVRMTAAAPFDYLVVHRGDPSHICVEPVTHVANAWNLDNRSGGARILSPNETLEGRVVVKIFA